MQTKPLSRFTVSCVTILGSLAFRAVAQDSHAEETGLLLKVLAESKHTLAEGIQHAAAKSPEAAISAKFELDDKGGLSLSVYTAEKGLSVDAEHNVLKELAGSPEARSGIPKPRSSRTWSTCLAPPLSSP